MKRLSLTQRLFGVTALALLPAVVVVASNVMTLRETRNEETHAEALRSAELASLEMERILSGTENVVRVVAATRVVRENDQAGCSAFLQRSVASLPYLASIGIADVKGDLWCLPRRNVDTVNVSDRPYFQNALAEPDRVTGEFTVGKRTGRRMLPIALQYADEQGRLAGVVVAYIDLGWLQSKIEERTYASGSSLTIADRDGTILAREPEPERFVGTMIPAAYQRLVHAPERGTEEVVSQDGTRRVIGYVPVSAEPKGIYVSSGISTDAAFLPVKNVAYSGVAISVLGMLAAFLLAAYTSRAAIVRPFARLADTLDAWRKGRTDVRTQLDPQAGEIGRVGASLDAFMDELLASRAAREQADIQRRLLAEELNHRVKNLLAMIQVVARQTFADTGAKEALATFSARLQAMGGANTLLLQDKWQAAPLRDVVENCIAPFRDRRSSQFKVDGPDLSLSSGAALAIGMALHELCTNAAKYGALSVKGGHVDFLWSVSEAGRGDQFTMVWTERDGPMVNPPSRTGFGSKIIKQVLERQIGGKVDLTYALDGVVCTISASLASIQTAAVAQAA